MLVSLVRFQSSAPILNFAFALDILVSYGEASGCALAVAAARSITKFPNSQIKKTLVLSIEFWYFPAIGMGRVTESVAREWEYRPAVPRRQPRRFWSHAMLFAASVLLMTGLFGERGLLESLRAQRAFAAAAHDLARLRQENDALREQARRLRNDPATIEALARGDLGLVRPGEILITVRDVKH